jgi:hypothetical protein
MAFNPRSRDLVALFPGIVLLAVGIIPYELLGFARTLFGWNVEGPGMYMLITVVLPGLVLGCLALVVGFVVFIVKSMKSD